MENIGMSYAHLELITDGSKPLENADYERFAQGVAGFMSATSAYRKYIAEKGTKTDTCMQNGSGLLAKLRPRVDFLKAQAAKTASEKFHFGKEELIGYLVGVVQTPVGEVDETHEFAQEMTVETKGGQRGRLRRGDAEDGNEEASEPIDVTKIKSFGKADAAKLLAKICGWESPDKVEHSGTLTVSVEVGEALDALLK